MASMNVMSDHVIEERITNAVMQRIVPETGFRNKLGLEENPFDIFGKAINHVAEHAKNVVQKAGNEVQKVIANPNRGFMRPH